MTIDALQIVQQAINAINPSTAVKSHFQKISEQQEIQIIGHGSGDDDNNDEILSLEDYDELVLVAFGKASSAMATAVLEQLQQDLANQERIQSSGIVICKDDHVTQTEQELLSKFGIKIQMASHPVPDEERSAQGAKAVLQLVQERASPRTLVICCISGGGSALFCQPQAPLTLEHLQSVNSALLGSGMGIREMNVIRKRLEDGKGGRLAAQCHPSKVVTLVLSDVLGHPLDLIASGPTVPDTSDWQASWEIVQKYNLADELPDKVMEILKDGLDGKLEDSPSPDHPVFQTSSTVLVGNNALAIEAAAKHAETLGYNPVVLGTQIEGEAKEIAHVYTGIALYFEIPLV